MKIVYKWLNVNNVELYTKDIISKKKKLNPACSRYLLETVFLLQFPAQLDCVPKCVQIWENAEVEQIANDVCHAKYF